MSEEHSERLERAYQQDWEGCRIEEFQGCFLWRADCSFANMTQTSWNGVQRKIMRVAVLAEVPEE